MNFWVKLVLALAIASIVNFVVFIVLKNTTTLNMDQLAVLRLFTGIPIGAMITGWFLKRR